MLSEKLKAFEELKQQIFEAFGYVEDWRAFPLFIELSAHWFLTGEEGEDEIVFSPTPFTTELIESGEQIFSAYVYSYRHLNKYVYRTDTHTMVLADPRSDLNIFLYVFDNKNQCTDEGLIEFYKESW
jgi:hypothetical protein